MEVGFDVLMVVGFGVGPGAGFDVVVGVGADAGFDIVG